MSNSQMKCPTHVQLDTSMRKLEYSRIVPATEVDCTSAESWEIRASGDLEVTRIQCVLIRGCLDASRLQISEHRATRVPSACRGRIESQCLFAARKPPALKAHPYSPIAGLPV